MGNNTYLDTNKYNFMSQTLYNGHIRESIQYTTCRDFPYISRYRNLRQVIHNPDSYDRFITLELCNDISVDIPVKSYVVPDTEENRLDMIAYKKLGSAQYAWLLAYVNNIYDGYTVAAGQVISVPLNITDLFLKDKLLAPVSAAELTLGSE